MADIATSHDFITIVTNAGVFLAAAGTVVVAIWSAFKKVKAALPDEHHGTKVVAGLVMDHASMMMWAESNKTVCAKFDDMIDEMRELRFALTQLKDKL